MRKLTKWLILFWMLHAGITPPIQAQAPQQLTLEQAYELARSNYPLIRQKELIQKTALISIENLQKGFLPQLTVSGQATYQSAVTEIKIPVPGVNVEPLSKDQYKLVADINQMIYDGGVNREQKNIQQLNANVEEQKLEVELYKLKERISQIYLGVLFFDEQLKQVELVKQDIRNGIKKVEAQVANGVAFRSNLNLLEAELLKAEQRTVELKASRSGLVKALSVFLNQSLPPDVLLTTPVVADPVTDESSIARPELQMFSSQVKLVDRQIRLIDAKNLPKASLFVQAGYGRPGLNFLKNEFEPYYISGVRLNWSLGGWYTQKKEKAQVEINRKMVDAQRETFLLNTKSSLVQQRADIDKLQQLISLDNDIIQLRVKVKEAAKAQLDYGVITANDYLREVNAEDLARQSLIAHQLQWLQARINYKNTSGN
jgi:outer membrane protein TolC